MARVRPNGSKRWVQNASLSSETYKEGISSPRREWESAASASESIWQAAIQEAVTQKRYNKGIKKAGNNKWKQRSLDIGAGRYVQGVQSSESSYAAGIDPFIKTIEGLTLPPRYQKGDPRNLERVKAVATALRNKKVGG